MKTHLQNHDYDPKEDVLRTYCGKSNYDVYIEREDWTDDISKVDCDECLNKRFIRFEVNA